MIKSNPFIALKVEFSTNDIILISTLILYLDLSKPPDNKSTLLGDLNLACGFSLIISLNFEIASFSVLNSETLSLSIMRKYYPASLVTVVDLLKLDTVVILTSLLVIVSDLPPFIMMLDCLFIAAIIISLNSMDFCASPIIFP